MDDLKKVIVGFQDLLVPFLDTYEQAIYMHILRNTYLSDKHQYLFNTRSAEIGIGTGDKTKKPSSKTRSKKLKSLASKGCISILERSNKGILVEIVLPQKTNFAHQNEFVAQTINIDEIDFYSNRTYVENILARENYRCFYTGKKLTTENTYLDHVIPQADGGDNSFKNIVASSFDANSMKNDKTVDEFIRLLFREELISLTEFNELKEKLKALKAGQLKPVVN